MYGEPSARVAPCTLNTEAAVIRDRLDHWHRELVTVLGMDGLPARERHLKSERRNIHRLRTQALKMHFDTRLAGIPDSPMLERIEIKIRVQFAIDVGEDVLIKGCGHAAPVVVRRKKYIFRLSHICPQQERVSGIQRRTHFT